MFHDFPTYKPSFQAGWWLTYPSEKYESMGRMTSHIWNGKSSRCSKPPTSIYIYICIIILIVDIHTILISHDSWGLSPFFTIQVSYFPFPKWPSRSSSTPTDPPGSERSAERLDLLGVANLPLPRHIVVVEGNGVDQGGSLYRSSGTWCSYGNWWVITCYFSSPKKIEKPTNSPLNWWRFMFRSFWGLL